MWHESLGSLEMTVLRQPEQSDWTLLEGRLVDQSALQGVLDTLFMLGLPLILVLRLEPDS